VVFTSLAFVVLSVVVFCLSWVLQRRRTTSWEADVGP